MTWVVVRNKRGEEWDVEAPYPNPMVGDYLEDQRGYIVHVMEDDDDDLQALELMEGEE